MTDQRTMTTAGNIPSKFYLDVLLVLNSFYLITKLEMKYLRRILDALRKKENTRDPECAK